MASAYKSRWANKKTSLHPPFACLHDATLPCANMTNAPHDLAEGLSATHTDITVFMQQGGDYECGAESGAATAVGLMQQLRGRHLNHFGRITD